MEKVRRKSSFLGFSSYQALVESLLPPVYVSYVTDVEGNLDYFDKFVEISDVLKYIPFDDPNKILNKRIAFRKKSGYFVFGGDAFDKGPGDIEFTELLIDFKVRYPDRVYLLMGNRDINKMRFSSELDESYVQQKPIEDVPGPFWVPESSRVTPWGFLKRMAEKELTERLEKDKENGNEKQNEKKFNEKILKARITELNTRVNRLKYLLKETLGCPNTFEFRRQEIRKLKHRRMGLEDDDDSENFVITDEEVFENFLYSVQDERGVVRRYLQAACLGCIIGSTLFVHGAVSKDSMAFLPSPSTPYQIHEVQGRDADCGAQEWISLLNEFAQDQICRWISQPTFTNVMKEEGRGGEALLAYQSWPAMKGRTVCIASYCEGGNMPIDPTETTISSIEKQPIDPVNPAVVRYLRKSGICRVVVGHKPTGDSPSILRYDTDQDACTGSLEVISADTSFSDMSSQDNRGQAVSEVVISGNFHCNRSKVHGILSNGTYHCTYLNTLQIVKKDGKIWSKCSKPGNQYVGKMLSGWWVKAKLINENDESHKVLSDVSKEDLAEIPDGEYEEIEDEDDENDKYLLSQGQGRNVAYKIVDRNDLAQLLLPSLE